MFHKYSSGSINPVTSKMKLFLATVASLQPLVIVIKSSILDIAEVLDLLLV